MNKNVQNEQEKEFYKMPLVLSVHFFDEVKHVGSSKLIVVQWIILYFNTKH